VSVDDLEKVDLGGADGSRLTYISSRLDGDCK
jgi:hypothetical protein